ncbi:hypothetical protein FPV67DRAFT_1588139 [Lyophyllum atratum]|nr:hypothetical protein FPV67DRAFT_1588139 [Lyophyllum atratum]
MLPVVPQEIAENIIRRLRGDPRTLQSCSLISWSFRAPSQQLLFHHIFLILRYTARNQRLHNVISKNPILASYVRFIHLEVDDMSLTPAEAICRILDITRPHLQGLSMGSSGTTFVASQYWNFIHSNLQNSLLSTISSPPCVGLTLGALSFPIQYLRVFHESVAEGDVSGDALIFYDPPRQNGYPGSLSAASFPLEHLLETLRDPDLASSLSPSPLLVLDTLVKPRAFSYDMILHLSEEYLEEVDIVVDVDLSKEPISFGRLSHLRVLRIELRVIQPAHRIARSLATIPLNTLLLELKMEWQIAVSVGKKGWLDIEAVLLDKWREGVLCSVVMNLHGWQRSGTFLNVRMPRLIERGIAVTR